MDNTFIDMWIWNYVLNEFEWIKYTSVVNIYCSLIYTEYEELFSFSGKTCSGKCKVSQKPEKDKML